MTARIEDDRDFVGSDGPVGDDHGRVMRSGRVSWATHPPHGTARIGVASRAFGAVAMSVPDADVVAHEAAPGELVAVTHAIFMAWKLSEVLVEAGSPADELTVDAECTFAGAVAERELVAVHLQIHGFVSRSRHGNLPRGDHRGATPLPPFLWSAKRHSVRAVGRAFPRALATMADTTSGQPGDGNQRGSERGAEPAGPASARRSDGSRGVRQYRPSRWRRVGDAIIGVFVRAGLVPSTYLLTTRFKGVLR